MGTILTASLCPDAHLRWAIKKLELICKAVSGAPAALAHQATFLALRSPLGNKSHPLPDGHAPLNDGGGRLHTRGHDQKYVASPQQLPQGGPPRPSEELGLNILTI